MVRLVWGVVIDDQEWHKHLPSLLRPGGVYR